MTHKGEVDVKSNEFLGKLKAMGKNVDWLAEQMNDLGEEISYSTIYKKLRGESEFTAQEIKTVTKIMGFSNTEMMDIFFEELVS